VIVIVFEISYILIILRTLRNDLKSGEALKDAIPKSKISTIHAANAKSDPPFLEEIL
jgi:hypothetical protein